MDEPPPSPIIDYFQDAPHRRLWPRRLVMSLGAVLIVAALSFALLKTSLALSPTYQTTNQRVDRPFVVALSQTVRSVDLSRLRITPVIRGSWSFKSGGLIGKDEIVFTPKTSFAAGTRYTVSSTDIHRVLFGTSRLESISFKTELAPDLAPSGLLGLKDGATIAADASFKLSLRTPNDGTRELVLRTTPTIATTEVATGDTTYTFTPTAFLPQGQPVTVSVYDQKSGQTLATKNLVVASAPVVVSLSKPTHLQPGDSEQLTFSEPIDTSSAAISFSVAGQGKWQSSTVYSFTPATVTPSQTYTYTIKSGLRSQSGGITTSDLTGSFTSTGAVNITATTPHGTGLKQASETISFTFDQAVDHASASAHFSVSSGQVGALSWQGNTFSAIVTNLGYQATVTAKMAAGVANTGFGAPSTQAFSLSFTTEIRTIRDNVPYFRQQYAGSCAAASLRMILAYHGISASDMDIVERMGYNPTTEDKSTNPPTWDDPSQMFVGSVNGSINAGTGAGPDAGPVAAAAQSYGLSAEAVTGIGVNWIAQQLYSGGLVVMFGSYSGSDQFVTWKTPSGRIEKMNVSSHARTVIGVKGNPDSPIGFWVSDPINGTQYWTASDLEANIMLDAYQQAVVVH